MTNPGIPADLSRRSLLRGALAGAAIAPVVTASPAVATPVLRTGRPRLTHGVQTGDVTRDGAVVWARSDRPARMFVQVSPTGRFDDAVRTVRGPLLLPDSDHTGRVLLRGLPPGTDVPYRVVLADPDAHRPDGDARTGRFRTAPATSADVRLLWSGDQAGQGWGANPDLGGFPIYRAMLARRPDLFLHCGDSVYADGPITGDVTLPDGRVYRNVLDEAKAKVAETLEEFRGNHRYNLADAGYQAFAAAVAQVNQWDDHEVLNNWYPGEILADPRYTVTDVDLLARRGYQAWHEYMPVGPARPGSGRVYRKVGYGPLLDVFVVDMRTYRNPNTDGREAGAPAPDGGILGGRQALWLVEELSRSRATWKIVQSDMPIGLVVPDGATAIEAIAQGDGAPLGRERQVAWILREIARRRIDGVVWLTADVHYTAAHHYDPARAAFTEFAPFWEFVSGPLHAGAFGPNALDPTFGPRVEFAAVPPRPNTSPLEGYQFFGEVDIDGHSRALTVHLRDLTGASLWTHTLSPVTR